MNSDSDDEVRIIPQNIYFKRLKGGANKNQNEEGEDIDDLPNLEYEETQEIIQAKVEPVEEVLWPEDILKVDVKHVIKVIMLFTVWCIYTICIITHEEGIDQPILLTILAKEENLLRLYTEPATKNVIQIVITGPFAKDQDIADMPKETEKQLKLEVLMKSIDQVKIISAKVGLLIERAQELEYVLSTTKIITFDLSEYISSYRDNFKLYLKLETNIEEDMAVELSSRMAAIDETRGIVYGTLVLLFLYILIIWEVINRTLASIVASTLAIGILAALNARPSTDKILRWLDVETLMLLFGMMVLVSILSESGIFDYLAVYAYELAQGKLLVLIYVLCFFTAFLSAFLDNVTMMLLMVPVTIRLCEVTNLNPIPVIMSMVLYSNAGAALTPVGDPPNVIIMTNHYVQENGVNFGNFIGHMAPGVILCSITIFIYLHCKYPNINGYMNTQSLEVEALKHEIIVWEKAAQTIQPTTTDEEVVQTTLIQKAEDLKQKLQELLLKGAPVAVDYEIILSQMKAAYPIRNKTLLIKSSIAFTFVLVLFSLHTVPDLQHLSLGWSALIGAILLIILAEVNIEAILSRVEWSTLLFFACLFILMEALTELGVIGALGKLCEKIVLKAEPNNRLLVAIIITLWVTGIASAFLDNIPVSTMMIKIVVRLCQNKELNLPLPPLVWAMAFGACFGGNGTLIGASANVVSSGVAEQHGYRFSFNDFFMFGFPIMVCTLIATTIYLYLAHCFWTWH